MMQEGTPSSAQGRHKDDQLDGIHVVHSHHQLGLLVLHQVVTPSTPARRTGGLLVGTSSAGSLFLSPGQQPRLLLLLCLWPVLAGQLKQLCSCLAVQGLGELVTGRRHFQTFTENSPWPLRLNVVGPFDKADEVPFGLDVLSDANILGLFPNGGFTTFLASCFFTMAGAGTTFFPLAFFPFSILGGRRREPDEAVL